MHGSGPSTGARAGANEIRAQASLRGAFRAGMSAHLARCEPPDGKYICNRTPMLMDPGTPVSQQAV